MIGENMSNINKNKKKLNKIMDKYNLTSYEKNELFGIINKIFSHKEFQNRMTCKFMHHGKITLGYHILQVTVVTYSLCKMNQEKVNLQLVLYIAMMHDLYSKPWQNNIKEKAKKISNKHGFRHPLESVINSLIWYKEIFDNFQYSYDLIDGIIHHMYPFPVRIFQNYNENVLELKNFEMIKNIDKKYIDYIIETTNINKIGNFSYSKPKTKEGKIVLKADKMVSIGNFDSINDLKACITGKNKNIKYKK